MARPNNPGICKAAEIHKAKTHCPKGHAYDASNTYHSGPEGKWRMCRACHTAAAKRWQIRKGSAQALAYF